MLQRMLRDDRKGATLVEVGWANKSTRQDAADPQQ
jgi:hypothetical protein